ncbi:MAG: hypothetical protein KIS78_28545 [Labilithrix sp.]|nr:hypothetical protein [Labilithrix sp.]
MTLARWRLRGRLHRRRTFAATTCGLALLATSVAGSGAPTTEASGLSPARVTLKVTPDPSGGPWRLQIENAGEGPVRVAADPRLLILELTPAPDAAPAKGKTAPAAPRCVLPADARPSTDDGSDLVMPAKRSWSTTFDPLFYCFGARERAALVPGTTVKARFGWPAPEPRAGAKPKAPAPPFAVTPVGASVGKVAPAKALEADAFSLTAPVVVAKPVDETAWGAGATDKDKEKDKEADGTTSAVTLSMPETMDAARGGELATTVTLTNGTDRPITLLYRPDMVQFAVSGPAGSVSCGSPRSVAAPIRELFVTVPVKGKTTTSVLLTTTCPAGTFDEPGVYRVTPRLDTTGASGRSIGLRTWDGLATGRGSLLVRVRSSRTPALPPRPTLD